jgi:uncharacterized protein YjbI with pentapeptide repeats
MRELVPDWRPARRQVLWTIRIVLVFVVVLSILTLVGWPFDVTLWNWLELLIIPVVLAIGGFLFTRSENRATRAAAERRALDDTLQAYLDGMSQLLTDKDQPLHRAQPGDSLRTVARARTLTVLGRLDRNRKRSVLQFLYESGLIYKEDTVLDKGSRLLEKRHHIVSLDQADMSEANLSVANLLRANLSGTNLSEANLSGALLSEANLNRTDLSGANLSRTFLAEADLSYANVSKANLSGALLSETNLRGTNLSGSDLSGAWLQKSYLFVANLSEANLSGADLNGAEGWTEEDLRAAKHLEGATMPDGQTLRGDKMPDGPTFEQWLKSQGRKENVENSGPP